MFLTCQNYCKFYISTMTYKGMKFYGQTIKFLRQNFDPIFAMKRQKHRRSDRIGKSGSKMHTRKYEEKQNNTCIASSQALHDVKCTEPYVKSNSDEINPCK